MSALVTLHVDVDTSGPMFNGVAEAELKRYMRAVPAAVAKEGKLMVKERLHQVLKHPTGYYESRVRIYANGALSRVIVGDNVIYGAWLEGVGSRNSPVTRFKGYRTFREVGQALDHLSGEIAELLLRDHYLPAMNG
jgi:hypothetical protein